MMERWDLWSKNWKPQKKRRNRSQALHGAMVESKLLPLRVCVVVEEERDANWQQRTLSETAQAFVKCLRKWRQYPERTGIMNRQRKPTLKTQLKKFRTMNSCIRKKSPKRKKRAEQKGNELHASEGTLFTEVMRVTWYLSTTCERIESEQLRSKWPSTRKVKTEKLNGKWRIHKQRK